jgi:hypothetical protein
MSPYSTCLPDTRAEQADGSEASRASVAQSAPLAMILARVGPTQAGVRTEKARHWNPKLTATRATASVPHRTRRPLGTRLPQRPS